MKTTTVRPTKYKTIFLSFVEEFWRGQIKGSVIARVEVERPSDHYPSEELRIACMDSPEYREFRDKYDFTYVSEKTLDTVRERIKREFLLGGNNGRLEGD